MVIKYIKCFLFSIFILFMSVAQSYAAAISICFSYKDIPMSENRKQDNIANLAAAIKNNDYGSVLYYMRSEISYVSGNPYKEGALKYNIKQKAIFWDAVLGNGITEVENYIAAKGDINELYPVDFFFTPLMAASRCGYKEIVQTLIDAGADVNKEGSLVGTYDSIIKGVTALSQAERQDHDEVVEILLKAGAIRKQPYMEKIKTVKQN